MIDDQVDKYPHAAYIMGNSRQTDGRKTPSRTWLLTLKPLQPSFVGYYPFFCSFLLTMYMLGYGDHPKFPLQYSMTSHLDYVVTTVAPPIRGIDNAAIIDECWRNCAPCPRSDPSYLGRGDRAASTRTQLHVSGQTLSQGLALS